MSILAIDAGLACGLACHSQGKILWYESRNFAQLGDLKRAVPAFVERCPELGLIIIEGAGRRARAWLEEARKREIPYRVVSAEDWRPFFFNPSEVQDFKGKARQKAGQLLQTGRPINHNAAEAILLAWWAASTGAGGPDGHSGIA
ncbi:MAG: hypothetical protein U0931_08880 [Vulcanimicrobiota bacterium]